MKLPKLVKESVARVKRAVKFNQPTPRSAIPEDVQKQKKFAELGYETDKAKIQNQLDGSGYNLDEGLSSNETKVFTNPATKEVTVAYRGTDLSKPSRWKDLRSDVAIATGLERYDPRFKQAKAHFKDVEDKYQKEGYKVTTTGHSLGGQLSKYVNDENQGKVDKNVAFSRGSGLLEPFRKKQRNTVDVSNKRDVISLGARLQGGKQVIEGSNKSMLGSHNLKTLFA